VVRRRRPRTPQKQDAIDNQREKFSTKSGYFFSINSVAGTGEVAPSALSPRYCFREARGASATAQNQRFRRARTRCSAAVSSGLDEKTERLIGDNRPLRPPVADFRLVRRHFCQALVSAACENPQWLNAYRRQLIHCC